MDDPIKIYRIRDRATGLWSSGGSSPRFAKRGKTWDQFGHVSSHLAGILDSQARPTTTVYDDAEIIEYVLTPTEGRRFDVKALLARKQRAALIAARHGNMLAGLVESLEKDERIERFRWCLLFRWNEQESVGEWLKAEQVLKRDTHVRHRAAYAFSDRAVAAGIRLSTPYTVAAFDLKEMVEGF